MINASNKVVDPKSYRDILMPVMDDLIKTRITIDEKKEVCMLELMSSDALCQLFLDAIDCYMDFVKYPKLHEGVEKIENRRKFWVYPKSLIETVKYLEYVQTQSKRPDMTKTADQIEALAQSNMIIHCFNFQLGIEGVTMKLR